MREIYMILRDDNPDYAGTHLRTFKTLENAIVRAQTIKKCYGNHVQIVRMGIVETIELEDVKYE